MKGKEWAKRFEAAFRLWVERMGLGDWAFSYSTDETSPSRLAEVEYNVDTRHCYVRAFVQNADVTDDPERVALHEALHVLLADFCYIAAKRASDQHKDVVREEHRVIERLQRAMPAYA